MDLQFLFRQFGHFSVVSPKVEYLLKFSYCVGILLSAHIQIKSSSCFEFVEPFCFNSDMYGSSGHAGR